MLVKNVFCWELQNEKCEKRELVSSKEKECHCMYIDKYALLTIFSQAIYSETLSPLFSSYW